MATNKAASNVDEIEFAINDDLKRVGSYCLTNELLLNLKPVKTEVMLFGTPQRLAEHRRNHVSIQSHQFRYRICLFGQPCG